MKRSRPVVGERGRPVRRATLPLSRDRIVRAALELVDREGLPALSMRKLGASLRVDPMAIYYHVPGKAALYDALVEAVMGEISLPAPGAGTSPFERLKEAAYAYKAALLAHPNALPVVAARPVRTVGALRPVEVMLGFLLEGGLSPAQAFAAVDACGHFILGSLQAYVAHLTNSEVHAHEELQLESLPREEFPHVHEVVENAAEEYGFEYWFEFGLDALLRGILSNAGKESIAGHE
jgi:TetR/AcrR family tetracycline transcriptional repressor